MNLQISKWGNSLALRIPAEIVRRLGVRDGDSLQAQWSPDGVLSIRPAGWSRQAFAAVLADARAALPEGQPVMPELRQDARY